MSKHLTANTRSTLQGYPGGKRPLDASVQCCVLITHEDINVKRLPVPGNLAGFVFAHRGGHIGTMNSTAWQPAHRQIGIRNLDVHDLRYTVKNRFREAEVRAGTIADIPRVANFGGSRASQELSR